MRNADMGDRWQDSFEDDFGDSDADIGEDGDMPDEPTVECPYCGFEMLEICLQCPRCGQYSSREDSQHRSHPLWVILTAVLTILAIVFWVLVL